MAWLVALALVVALPASAGQRVASFGFEWVNTSLEPTRPDEAARLTMLEGQLAAALAGRGYEIVDTAPVAARAKALNLRSCAPCELDLARELAAELAVLGWVQKVSNLILNVNLQVHDVASGALVGAGSVDIRGNTDESWGRGLRSLLDRQIRVPPG